MVYSSGPRRRQVHRALPATTRPSEAVRLRRRDPVLADDHMHGGWWPHSRDLEAELPGLLDELAGTGFTTHRVTYSTRGWDVAPRSVTLAGIVVTLVGSYTQHAATLILSDNSRRGPLVFMVVPHSLEPEAAMNAMSLAAEDGNADRIVEILDHVIAHGTADRKATIEPHEAHQ